MELINISLNKYALTCPSCYELAIFYIIPNRRNIQSECRGGHKYENISYNSFIECCMTEIWSSNKTCAICNIKIYEFKDNYICKICGYIFCNLCIETHFIKSNHNDKVKYINYNSICQFHNKEYKFYCKACNSNLCNECKIIHKAHSIKSYKNLLKYIRNETKYFNSTIEDNKKKYELCQKYDYDKRKNLDLLYHINEYYLKNFNFELFNFYHFQNFKYFYKFVTKQLNKIAIKSLENYYEYTQFLHFKISNKSFGEKDFKYKKYLFCNNTFVCYNNNLLFIFNFIPKCCYLKLFEIKNYCLRYILLKKLEYNITFYRPMQKLYGYIFVFNNILKIFQYDENNQRLILKDEYNVSETIKEPLDLKNGDIVIATNLYLRIIKDKKQIKSFFGKYDCLHQPNDLMFISRKNSEIIFFDSSKYQIIKKINIFPDIEDNISINDKFILAMSSNNIFTYIIDIKYLEIIQVIENEKIYNKFFYKLYRNNDYYIVSNNQIQKYNIYTGKLINTLKYYIDFTVNHIKIDKNQLFLIGRSKIAIIDLLS